MALDIESVDGVVQLVLPVEILEAFLARFPAFNVYRMPIVEDDLPTYGISLKEIPSHLHAVDDPAEQ